MLRRLQDSLPLWHRAVRRRRRLLSLLLAAVLAAIVVPGLLPASARTHGVLVAASDLPPGTVLAPADLQRVEVADSLVPADSTDAPEALMGLRLDGAVAEGEVLAPGRLGDAAQEPALDGLAVLVVPIEPALLPRVAAGDDLALILSTTDPGRTRRIDAVVVEVPAAPAGQEAITGTASTEAREILVAVDPSRTGDIAHAVREGWLQAALVF
jgi:hypothetical protein